MFQGSININVGRKQNITSEEGQSFTSSSHHNKKHLFYHSLVLLHLLLLSGRHSRGVWQFIAHHGGAVWYQPGRKTERGGLPSILNTQIPTWPENIPLGESSYCTRPLTSLFLFIQFGVTPSNIVTSFALRLKQTYLWCDKEAVDQWKLWMYIFLVYSYGCF